MMKDMAVQCKMAACKTIQYKTIQNETVHDRIMQAEKGYLTVYLTLVLTVLLSLCLALIEGVRSNAVRTETECVTDIGLNSILAEYHRELFRQYNLFAIDSSYGTQHGGVEGMAQHLQTYLERNFSLEDVFLPNYFYRDFLAIEVDSIEMTGASIMTDEKGAVFRRRAVEAVKSDYNLTLFQDLQQWMEVIEVNGLRERDVAKEKSIVDEKIQKYNGSEIQISETETGTVQVQNPTGDLEKTQKEGILKYVVEDVNALSAKSVVQDNLIFARMERGQRNQGNMPLLELSDSEQFLEKFLFQEYLMRYLGYYGAEKEAGALSYQIEYLITGNDTDVTNLKEVVNMICFIREAANTVYIFTDEEKCAEAELAATVLAALLQVPEIASLLKTALLLGWAYAESLYDVEQLLSGNRIPLMKDKNTWHYDLDNALALRDTAKTDAMTDGLCYGDYLRLLLLFADMDTLTGRAMNMVEADIRLTSGNAYFRLDNCYDRVEFCIHVSSKYGYEYEITRKKGY